MDSEFRGLNALKIMNCDEKKKGNNIHGPLYKKLKMMGDFIPPKS